MNIDSSTPPKPDQPLPTAGKNRHRLLLALFGLTCFGGLLYIGDFSSLGKMAHPNYPWLIAALLGTGCMLFVYSVRWGLIVNSLVSRRVTSHLSYFFYSLSSLALGAIVPHTAGTFIGKAAALNKLENISWKNSSISILLDKIFDGFFMVMFSWPFFLLLTGKASTGQVALISCIEFIIASLLIIYNYPLWIRLLQNLLSVGVKITHLLPFLTRISPLQNIAATQNLQELKVLQKKTILQVYFLTAFGQIMLAIRAWLAAMALGIDVISPLDAFVGIGFVQASVLISFTPGALGFSDAAWFITFAAAGVPKEIITVFIIAFRLIENLAIVVWWLPLYFYRMIK